MTGEGSGGEPARPPGIPARKNRWGTLGVLLLLGAGIAFIVLRWREPGFDWTEFVGTFRRIRWQWIAAASLMALLTYYGRALRWRVLMRPVKRDASLLRLTVATAIGFTATTIFGRAGELVRPYLIAVKEGVSFPSQAAAWLIERIYDLLTALLIFGFALIHVHASGLAAGPALGWVLRIGGYAAAALATLCLGLLFVFARFAEPMKRRLLAALAFLPEASLERARGLADAFARGVASTRCRNSTTLISLYSLLEWLVIVGAYLCLFRAFPETGHFSLMDVGVFVGFVSFGAVVQIPGIGGGLQVVSVVVLTELFGVSLEAASGIALVLWATTFVVIVPFGVLLAFHEGLTWRKLRNIREVAAVP